MKTRSFLLLLALAHAALVFIAALAAASWLHHQQVDDRRACYELARALESHLVLVQSDDPLARESVIYFTNYL